ncbi:hypothetical protein [Desulfovibrio piger]|uniref:hypothetical protein n=1 Tax=Desulfovibrio piger TaxID=901 RepID=UPI0039F63FF5
MFNQHIGNTGKISGKFLCRFLFRPAPFFANRRTLLSPLAENAPFSSTAQAPPQIVKKFSPPWIFFRPLFDNGPQQKREPEGSPFMRIHGNA